MPDVLEPPIQITQNARNRGLVPFDHERATLAGIRSGQVRRQRAGLQPVTPTHKPEPDHVQRAINAQLNLVAEQITRTRAVLNDDKSHWCAVCERGGMEPHHRAQLLRALDSLLDRQRKLLGIPDPGSRKPAPERRQSSDERPLAPVPCVPGPTTNSVNQQLPANETPQGNPGQ